MTITLKFGRKRMKQFLPGIMKNIEGYINFQNYMWIMVNDSMKKYQKKNNIEVKVNPYGHDVFQVNLYKEEQDLDEEYKMEWLICDIKGNTPEDEEEEYKQLEKFEDSLKCNFDKNKSNFIINKPNSLFSNIMQKAVKTKESILDIIEKGIEQDSDKSISQFLLDIDIIIVKLKSKN